MAPRTFTTVGAIAGLVLYLVVGLVPCYHFGAYAGALLAQGIFGSPLRPTLLVRALMFFGALLGAVGVSGLFAVLGAMAGAGAWGVAGRVARRDPEEA